MDTNINIQIVQHIEHYDITFHVNKKQLIQLMMSYCIWGKFLSLPNNDEN